MKTDYRKSRKRGIILLYAAVVVVPGLILGYMALRGILNDQAIREKESRQRLESVKESFFSALDSVLFGDFNLAFGQTGLTRSINSVPGAKAAMRVPVMGDPRLIGHNLLYLPEEFIEKQPAADVSANPDFEEAQRMEFADGQLAAAADLYRNVAAGSADTLMKVKSLVGGARVLRQLKRDEEAKTLYLEIAEKYPEILISNKIPARHTAWLELAEMEASAGNATGKKNYCNLILKSLLNPDIPYGPGHFSFMNRRIKELAAVDDTVSQALLTSLEAGAAETNRICEMILQPRMILSDRNLHIIPLGTGLFLRSVYFNNLVTLTAESQPPEVPGQQILILDLKARIESIITRLISGTDPSGTLNWQVTDEEGGLVFLSDSGEHDFQKYNFPDGFPKWSLAIYDDQPGLLASFLTPGSGVFVLVFIFIIIIMLAGLLFTLHSLNQEIRLNALKSEFIANVSHELKSPLTSIRLRAELLTENRVPISQQSEYYSNILDQSEQLSHLIENILDFSRIEDDRKKYQFEEISLIPYLRKIVDSFSQRQIGTKIRIDLIGEDDIPRVRIDREAMQQVVYNLLDNACKFSADSQRIEVLAEGREPAPDLNRGQKAEGKNQEEEIRQKEKGEWVVVRVRDWGMGISEKDQERIFERFYRAEEGRKRGIKGSGIGLTLVKRIVEAHGGRITVESEPGKGTTFKIYLPVS